MYLNMYKEQVMQSPRVLNSWNNAIMSLEGRRKRLCWHSWASFSFSVLIVDVHETQSFKLKLIPLLCHGNHAEIRLWIYTSLGQSRELSNRELFASGKFLSAGQDQYTGKIHLLHVLQLEDFDFGFVFKDIYITTHVVGFQLGSAGR